MPETRKNPETNLDASLHSSQARVTGGLSPLAAYLAWSDWVLHLANAPGKMSDATVNAIRRGLGMELQGAAASPAHVADHRFDHPVWSFWPFAQYAATQQLAEAFWNDLTTGVPGTHALVHRSPPCCTRVMTVLASSFRNRRAASRTSSGVTASRVA